MKTMGEGKILGLAVNHSRTMSHQCNTIVEKVWTEGVPSKIISTGTDSIALSISKISFKMVSAFIS